VTNYEGFDSPPSIFPRHHNFDVFDPKYMTGM
jgi:hypothetical protein